MVKNPSISTNAIFILKDLLFSYLLTALLLLLTAFFLYRFQPSAKTVSLFLTAIYVIATFTGGFLAGKKIGVRKFLWGLIAGLSYFLLLVILSLLFGPDASAGGGNFFSVLVLCMASGMLGGMVS